MLHEKGLGQNVWPIIKEVRKKLVISKDRMCDKFKTLSESMKTNTLEVEKKLKKLFTEQTPKNVTKVFMIL